MRSDGSVRLVRRSETAPRPREWGADVRTLFAGGSGADTGWRPWHVLGGPGTGKTALLTDLAVDRILAAVDPESVLILTHSKQAALRVRTALTRQLSAVAPELGGVPGVSREPMVRTVHSYAFSILRTHATSRGNPPPRLLTGAEQDVVLREMLRGELSDIRAGEDALWPQRLHAALGTDGFAEQLRDLMLRATERDLGPEDLLELGRMHDRAEWEAAGAFALRYEQTMLLRWSVGVQAPEASAPALDAAGLVGAALDVLIDDEDLLAAERERARLLLVDDAQHVDPLAAQLIRAIGSGPATTVIAGDPDQAVFGFRGADTRFVTEPDAPPERRIVLHDDHRCAPAVHAAVTRVAARMPGRAPHRFTERSGQLLGDPVVDGQVQVRVLTTPAKEAAVIADHLRRAHLTAEVPWSRMAVVVRSVPLSLGPLRRALTAAGVPVLQPKPDTPLARRRGAAWMLQSLRALLAAERDRPGLFTEDDALDLLLGPLGGADQISLRRLRRGVRRAIIAKGYRVPDTESAGDGTGRPGVTEEPREPRGDAGSPGSADPVPPSEVAGDHPESRTGTGGSADPAGLAAMSSEPGPDSGGEPDRPVTARGATVPDEVGLAPYSELDRSSALVLRDLITGAGDRSLLQQLTEVEVAPLVRVLKAVDRARRVLRRGAGVEDVLWALWTASRLEKRWVAQSERGGPGAVQADRDLDAAVGLFDAAATYVDRLPGAAADGFVEYLEQQEINQDSAPLTEPGDAVAIVSAHAAAGREWDVVAVAGVQEGIWPNLRSRGTLLGVEELVDLVDGVADPGEQISRSAPILAEERRLLLLACSRARHSLLVTAVESVTGDRDLVPSRFLAELDPEAAPGEPGRIPAPADPGRALVAQALIAELRGVVCDESGDPDRRERAATQLARLARAGVRGAHPDEWYGIAAQSCELALWDDGDGPVALSPSTVELLKTCPLRWALERHGGDDGDNPHAVKGNLVHTLVQALAGRVTEEQVKAALVKAWKAVDPSSGDDGPRSWHSRLELQRTETMVDTFLAWLRNTRDELAEVGVEVPVDCVLPARDPDEVPVRIRGRVDRVERDAQGRFVIVDIKTGKTPISKQSAQEHAQLATYQVAAGAGALSAEVDGQTVEPGGARLVYVAKPSRGSATERVQGALDDEGITQWRKTVHEAAAATRGPGFLAMRNDGCRHCRVAGSCPVQDAGRQVTDP
ncbi:ATP-dependent DNA helicase [Nocardia nova]|uniref:ATP-dependent DNA helicase n=1 Tax=Nocardia nova TaxID=37330 RepID=UPI003409CEEE